MLFFQSYPDHRDLHSFPTRRSSDLGTALAAPRAEGTASFVLACYSDKYVASTLRHAGSTPLVTTRALMAPEDRKSTRLNSSHSQISYAVFCLKKKKNIHAPHIVVIL